MKKNNALQRIIAGSLAALLTFTALPEWTITALAASQKIMITDVDAETNMEEKEYEIPASAGNPVENQSELSGDLMKLGHYVSAEANDQSEPDEDDETVSRNNYPEVLGAAGDTHKITVYGDSNIVSFTYTIEGGTNQKDQIGYFNGRVYYEIPYPILEGSDFSITSVETSNDGCFAYNVNNPE